MGLPLSRSTNYSPGVTPVKGVDLNSIQDCIVGGKRGAFRRNVPLTFTFVDSTNTWAQTGGGIKSTAVAGATIGGSYIDCPYDVGDQMLGLEVWRKSDGTSGTKEAQLILAAASNFVICTIGTDSIASAATTRSMLSVPASSGINHVMAAGEKLQFVFVGKTSPGYIIDCVNLVVARP
jgi:hypothetical protein